MDISSEEAKKALEQAETASNAARIVKEMAGADKIVMMWGTIWFCGFLWSHLVEKQGWSNAFYGLWFILIALGIGGMIRMNRNNPAPVKNTTGKRIGFFWFSMYAYMYIFMALLHPYLKLTTLNNTTDGAKVIGAVQTIIPMFAYIVMGLWLEQNWFIYMGIAFTLLTLAGFFLVYAYFFLFMALVGGIIFFACGIVMRIRWQRAMHKVKTNAEA